MSPRILLCLPGAALLLGTIAASPAAAQDQAPDPQGWTPVLRVADTRHELDSLAVARTGTETYRFRHRMVLLPPSANPRGEPFDRLEGVSEYDCARRRYRHHSMAWQLGEEVISLNPMAATWSEMEPDRRELFDHTCALLGRIGTRAGSDRAGRSVADRLPELVNRTSMAAAIVREYPPMRRDARETGDVELRFRVLASGDVDSTSIRVIGATGPDFARAAMRVAARMRFRPATMGSRSVPAWVELPIQFRLERGELVPVVRPR